MEPTNGHVRVTSSLADKEGSKFTLQVSASDGEKLTTDNAVVDVSSSTFLPRVLLHPSLLPILSPRWTSRERALGTRLNCHVYLKGVCSIRCCKHVLLGNFIL